MAAATEQTQASKYHVLHVEHDRASLVEHGAIPVCPREVDYADPRARQIVRTYEQRYSAEGYDIKPLVSDHSLLTVDEISFTSDFCRSCYVD